jgi:hypothetical protein
MEGMEMAFMSKIEKHLITFAQHCSLARVDSSEDIQDIDHASTIESDGDIDGYDSGLDYKRTRPPR